MKNDDAMTTTKRTQGQQCACRRNRCRGRIPMKWPILSVPVFLLAHAASAATLVEYAIQSNSSPYVVAHVTNTTIYNDTYTPSSYTTSGDEVESDYWKTAYGNSWVFAFTVESGYAISVDRYEFTSRVPYNGPTNYNVTYATAATPTYTSISGGWGPIPSARSDARTAIVANNGGVSLTNLTGRIFFRIYANGSTRTDNPWSAWYHSQMKVVGSLYALPGQAPTNVLLSGTNVEENLAVGTAVGAFSTQDPDAGNTFTYSLVAGTGSGDNGSFSISGSNLLTAAMLNYEVKSNYSIRIQSADQGGLFTQKIFAVGVIDVDEVPPSFSEAPALSGGNMVVRWGSLTNHTYALYGSTNLLSGFAVLQNNITGTPPINAYTDTVTAAGRKFWKVVTDP